MVVSFSLSNVKLTGGQELSFPADGITIIVGPNNCGKSTLLREIDMIVRSGLQASRTTRVVVADAQIQKDGDLLGLETLMQERTREFVEVNGQKFRRGLNLNINDQIASHLWFGVNGLQDMSALFCALVDTKSRLDAAASPNSINTLDDVLSHPIHVLADDEDVEKKFSDFVEMAFGKELVINPKGGNRTPLHIGKRPLPDNDKDRYSRSFLEKLRKLPEVQTQGDGIKSFIGCLLWTLAVKRFLTLVDEPEAFLHPPQAKVLGRILAQEITGNQLVIATHSGDLLRGVLDAAPKCLKVVRLTRDGDQNKASVLENDEVKELWSDPILRFSNVLDSLFHEGVIICESDNDCRFYSAVLTAVMDKTKQRIPDLMFTHTGGKHRMHVVANALKKINVPTQVIADFDLLSDQNTLKILFESLGGEWSEIKKDYEHVRQTIESKSAPLTLNQVEVKILKIFEENKGSQSLSGKVIEQINATMRTASPWGQAKRSGLDFLNGEPYKSCERLLGKLKANGLFVVPVGEMEDFDRSANGRKGAWLANVLEQSLADSPKLEGARMFIRELVAPQPGPTF